MGLLGLVYVIIDRWIKYTIFLWDGVAGLLWSIECPKKAIFLIIASVLNF